MTPTTSKPPQRKKTSVSFWFSLSILLFGGGGGLIYFYPTLLEKLYSPSDKEVYEHYFQDQKRQVQAIEKTLDSLQSHIKDIRENQAFIIGQLKELASKSIETSTDIHKSSLFQDFFNLKMKINSSHPFENEYNNLRDLLNHEQQELLKKLDPYRKIGIPQLDYLIAEFETVENSLLKKTLKESNWIDIFITRLKKLVTISKKGQTLSENYGDIIENIKTYVKERNLKTALKLSLSFSKTTPEKEQWEQHIQAYLDAQTVMEDLSKTLSVYEKGSS